MERKKASDFPQELLNLFGSITQQQDAEGGVVVHEDAAFPI